MQSQAATTVCHAPDQTSLPQPATSCVNYTQLRSPLYAVFGLECTDSTARLLWAVGDGKLTARCHRAAARRIVSPPRASGVCLARARAPVGVAIRRRSRARDSAGPRAACRHTTGARRVGRTRGGGARADSADGHPTTSRSRIGEARIEADIAGAGGEWAAASQCSAVPRAAGLGQTIRRAGIGAARTSNAARPEGRGPSAARLGCACGG